MEVTITTLSEVQQEADIQVGSDELRPHFEKAYEQFRPKAQVRGFRKGKVPLAMIKKLYGEALEHDALDTIAEELYRKAMEEKKIRPLGTPALTDMDFKRGTSLRFKIKYEVRPSFTLAAYKGVAVEKPIHLVTDGEVEGEILHLRRINSTVTPVDKVTTVDHIVTADVQELDASGAPLIGKKTSSAKFYLYDETLAPEIKEALSAAEVGGLYHAEIESRHGDHAHQTRIAITVTKIERVDLPALDEPLIRKLTGDKLSSVDEFRKSLRTDLSRYWEEQANTRVRDALADEIVRSHEFPIPESLVNGFLDSFLEEIKKKSPGGNLPRDFNEKKFREENRAYAIWQAKWMLLQERIAEVESITVTDEDLQGLAEKDAPRMGIGQDRLLQYYKDSGTVKERILSDKITAFLRHHAVVTERVIEPAAVQPR